MRRDEFISESPKSFAGDTDQGGHRKRIKKPLREIQHYRRNRRGLQTPMAAGAERTVGESFEYLLQHLRHLLVSRGAGV